MAKRQGNWTLNLVNMSCISGNVNFTSLKKKKPEKIILVKSYMLPFLMFI